MRTLIDGAATGLAVLATVLVVAPLVAILFILSIKARLAELGLLYAQSGTCRRSRRRHGQRIVGSGILLGVGSLIGIPMGIAAASIWPSSGAAPSWPTRFASPADVLNGVPSIVMGIAVYSLVVFRRVTFRPSPAAWRWAL